jgi:hypothetical protein
MHSDMWLNRNACWSFPSVTRAKQPVERSRHLTGCYGPLESGSGLTFVVSKFTQLEVHNDQD